MCRSLFPALFVTLLVLASASADVTLPALISDNMILQSPQAALWGKADPGEDVTIILGKSMARTTADKEGRWRLMLDGLKPGLAGSMTIAGKNTLAIQNVAVGDVWVGSGQSNMDMPVGPSTSGVWKGSQSVLNAEQEIIAANFPQIRMFTVAWKGSETPTEEVEGKWEVCTPKNIPNWSAVGYFFSRQLHQDLGLPIGFIRSCLGGTSCPTWTPTEVLQADPEFKKQYYTPRQEELKDYPQLKEKYDKELLPAWQAASEAAKASGRPLPQKPEAPYEPGHHGCASTLYNGMIAGATKCSIKGAIWYQGEFSVGDPASYRRLLPAMIASWRKAWKQPDLPFYIVQLASFMPQRPEAADSNWANLREVQREVASKVPHSGLAVAIDLGEAENIHPANKQEVGRRLALVAEAKTYGKAIVYSGPAFDAAAFEGGQIKIIFKPDTARGLVTLDGGPIKGFAIAGEDKHFVWAEAKIVPGTDKTKEPILLVSSPEVPNPVAVRYAWADNPEVNLVNKEGLPAVPFRTDD